MVYFMFMGRKPKYTSQSKILDSILTLLLLPPYFLKKIGDGVLIILKKAVKLATLALQKINYFLDLTPWVTIRLLTNWIKQLIQKETTIPESKEEDIVFPERQYQLPQIPKLVLPKLPISKILQLRLKLPKYPQLPKITILHLPPIRLPQRPQWKRPHISLPQSFIKFEYFVFGIIVSIIFIFIPYNIYTFLKHLPNPDTLALRDIPATTKIYDRKGTLLYEIYADQNRTPVKLDQIPKVVKDATIAIEDKDFYYHQGVSLKALSRALYMDLKYHTVQGGSTITQQLIKSALLTPERTVTRKIKEIILAFWAERSYTKDQILEMYLNQISYGGTAWGIEAASETYFGKTVKDLTLGEAALLAGLPAGPTLYSPFGAHPEYTRNRQKEVLQRMVEDGYITSEEENAVLKQDLKFAKIYTPIKAPHFVMYVKDLLEQKYGPRVVEQGGLRVTTSLDLDIQKSTEEIIKANLESLKNLNVGNGAALITNPKTGEVLAMVGSKDYFDTKGDGNVNVALSPRQPGSSIKIVNYAAALQKGYTAGSILDDSPITYQTAGQPPYSPINYDGKYHGKLPLRNALANSYNIPAVKVLASIGVKTMIDEGKKMGISTWNDENRFGLSLTLGGGEVTMLDMAKVYGTLANKGTTVSLLPILKVTDYKGNILEEEKGRQEAHIVPESVAFILSDILSDNNARSAAFGPNSALNISGKTVAVKTGTSNDKRDNWTIGYTPSYVVTVWVGNNDNSPMNPILTSGITGASPIWHDIMNSLLKNGPNESFREPSDIVSLPCYGHNEYFVKGTEPKGGCAPLPTLTPTPGR